MRNISIAEQTRELVPKMTPERQFYNGTKWRNLSDVNKIKERINRVKQIRNELATRGLSEEEQFSEINRIMHNSDMLKKQIDSPKIATRESLVLSRKGGFRPLETDKDFNYNHPRISLAERKRRLYLKRNKTQLENAERSLRRSEKIIDVPASKMIHRNQISNAEIVDELQRKRRNSPNEWLEPDEDEIPESRELELELDDEDEIEQFHKVKHKKQIKKTRKGFKRVNELIKRLIRLKRLRAQLLKNPPKVSKRDAGYYDEYKLQCITVQHHIDQTLRKIASYSDPITGYGIQVDGIIPEQETYEREVEEKKSWWEKAWDGITEWTKKTFDPVFESIGDFIERNEGPIKAIGMTVAFIGGIFWKVIF